MVATELESRYQRTRKPITVSFRMLVPWIPYNSPRFTHQLHSYPAKVIPQIPNFFLNCRRFIVPGSIVLDPFCGSGTVQLEACLAGINSVASDANPLARLLTRVKTTVISPSVIAKGMAKLRLEVAKCRASNPPDVVNITHWYTPNVIRHLARIAACIQRQPENDFKQLCYAALSVTARKASLADPRVSVPVRLNPARYPKTHWLRAKSKEHLRRIGDIDVKTLFFQILSEMGSSVESLWPLRGELGRVTHMYCNSLGFDTGSLRHHKEESIDAIITSPPYLGAQKYVRATSLSLGWLSLAESSDLRRLEDNTIGREHFLKGQISQPRYSGIPLADNILRTVREENPLRAHIAAQYLNEMREVIQTCIRLLKSGGVFVLVSGANELCGRVFNTTAFLHHLCLRERLVLRFELRDSIHSRGLMTRRNKTAGLIPFESVTVFQKQ